MGICRNVVRVCDSVLAWIQVWKSEKTEREMSAILMHPDYWRYSQLSIARFYGGITIQGETYLVDGKTNYLVRSDFTTYVSELGMPTVEKAVKRYADKDKARKILNRLARIVKARRKAEKRQRKEDITQLTLYDRT